MMRAGALISSDRESWIPLRDRHSMRLEFLYRDDVISERCNYEV